MIEVIESISFVFIGALIGLLTNIILEHRKKRIEKIDMAKLFVCRIKSHLDQGIKIEELMRKDLTNKTKGLTKETIDQIRILVIHFERDDIYNALISKMGSFSFRIVEKIVLYFDSLNLYVQDLKKLKWGGDLERWEDFYMINIMGIECQMYLNKEILQDNDQFNNNKELLKEEYHNRFMSAIKECKSKGIPTAGSILEHEKERIETIFGDFKILKELNCE